MNVLRLRKDAAAWREVDGEVLILGLDSSTYFSTNSSGSILWKRLADGATRDELVESLLATFDVDEERAVADVDAFIGRLTASDLLES